MKTPTNYSQILNECFLSCASVSIFCLFLSSFSCVVRRLRLLFLETWSDSFLGQTEKKKKETLLDVVALRPRGQTSVLLDEGSTVLWTCVESLWCQYYYHFFAVYSRNLSHFVRIYNRRGFWNKRNWTKWISWGVAARGCYRRKPNCCRGEECRFLLQMKMNNKIKCMFSKA